jgi:CRP/FNR family transcriptional regulator, cyclic AMP receptor protein
MKMTREEMLRILMRDKWFASLPAELVGLILKHSFEREYPAGKTIFNANDEPNGQFAVLEGEVRLVSHSDNGKDVLFDRFHSGAWFGHLSVLDGLPRFQDAVACCHTRVLQLPMAGFQEIITKRPQYVVDFARLICFHIRVAMQAVIEARTSPFPERLARLLINLEGLPEKAHKPAHQPRVTQEAIAAMTGTTRQTVSRLLKEWQRDGLISIHYGRAVILKPEKLSGIAKGRFRSRGATYSSHRAPRKSSRAAPGHLRI